MGCYGVLQSFIMRIVLIGFIDHMTHNNSHMASTRELIRLIFTSSFYEVRDYPSIDLYDFLPQKHCKRSHFSFEYEFLIYRVLNFW